MKVKKTILILIMLVLTIVVGSIVCYKRNFWEKIAVCYSLDKYVMDGELIIANDLDNIGGVGNDGIKIFRIKFTDNRFLNRIKDDKEWTNKRTELVDDLMYGKDGDPDALDENGKPAFDSKKKFTEAYYFIKNLNSNESNELTEKGFSMLYLNYVLAVYDCNNRTLYYYEYNS